MWLLLSLMGFLVADGWQWPVSGVRSLTGHWSSLRMRGPLTQEAGPGRLPGPGTLGCQSVLRGPRLQTLQCGDSEDTAVSAAVTTWHIPSNAARQLTPKSEQCISSDICCNTASHVWHGVEASQVTFVYTVQLTCNAVCICHGDLLLLSDVWCQPEWASGVSTWHTGPE